MTRVVAFDDALRLCIDGAQPVLLRPAGRVMVKMMLARRGRVVSRDALVTYCCPRGGMSREIVRAHIHHARRLLRGIGCADMIESAWGQGYRIDPQRYRLDATGTGALMLALSDDVLARLERYAGATGEAVPDAAASLLLEALQVVSPG